MPRGKPKSKSYSFWSLFDLFKSCPYCYGLAKDLGAQGVRFPVKLIQPTYLGTVFHKLMEEKVRKSWSWRETRANTAGIARLIGDEETRYSVSTRRSSMTTREILDILGDLDPLAMRLIGGGKMAEEYFGAEIAKGVRIHGRVDLVGKLAVSSGRLVPYTVDYKCSKSPSPKVTTQCIFYHLCGAPKKAFVIYPVRNEVKKINVTPEKAESVRTEALRLIEGVESGDRSKNLKSCARCFFGKYEVNGEQRVCSGYSEKLKEWREYYAHN